MRKNQDPRHVEELTSHITNALVAHRQRRRQAGVESTTEDEVALAHREARRFFEHRAGDARNLPGEYMERTEEARITKEALDLLLGTGPLQRLLDDPDITDIHVRGTAPVWTKRRDGSRIEVDPIVDSDEELVRLVRNIASRSRYGERRFDSASVECNLCLEDGSRLFAVMDVSQHPALIVRKHQFQLSSLDELVRGGLMPKDVSDFLGACVLSRRNIIVAGGTGTGKTTLLRALMNEIPFHERIVTIEDAFELGIDRFAQLHPDHDALQARQANIEGHGAIPLADLTRMALRMDPDRVIVGEVRGAEAFPMLLAMSQGNNGSMCTIHADSTKSVFSKLAAYVSMANTGLPIDVVNLLIANAVHVVVHIELGRGGRRITSIREVVDSEGAHIVSNEIFATGTGSQARPSIPMSARLRDALESHGQLERRVSKDDSVQW
jgi:pilus assembly protein CpaF